MAAIGMIWLFFLLFVYAIVAVAWHELMPVRFAWLSDAQLSTVRTFVFSSFVISTAGGYLMRRLG